MWEDETSNNRDLVTKINGNDPAVTTGFFGGAKSVRFNTANKRESMQYWTGTNFYTGDIGIVMVMHPVTLPKDSEAYTSASFGGSIRPLHTDRDYEFKHVIGIVERGGMHQIVVMNGEGGTDHGYFGSLEAGRSYVITSYVRDGEFNNRHWLDQALMMDRDNGDNDLDGWGVGSRETAFVDSGGTRYANGAIGFLAFVQMDGLTEDDLLRVRDEVAAEFGVAGF